MIAKYNTKINYTVSRDILIALLIGLFSAQAYAKSERADYVIITTEAIVSRSKRLGAFVDSKRDRGFSVSVVTESQWGGGDTGDARSENIRKWLRKNRISMGIEYVLLIGNPISTLKDGVPMKMALPSAKYHTPTDYYYGELKSNWDSDGDGKFGEFKDDFANGKTAPIKAQLKVGRIPCYGAVCGYPTFEGSGKNDLSAKGALDDPSGDVTFIVKIHKSGKVDTFVFSTDGGKSWSKTAFETAGKTLLRDRVTVAFKSTTGHKIGDTWTFRAREHLDDILQKTIDYENAPISSIAWRFKALIPMNEPYGDGSGYLLGEEIRHNIIEKADGWSYHRIYKKDYKLDPPQESTGLGFDNIVKAWQGCQPGFVTWLSHGIPARAKGIIHGMNAPDLDNTKPVINFHASCLTGKPEDTKNLAFCLLKNGAVGVVSGSRVTFGSVHGSNWRTDAGDAAIALRFSRAIINDRMTIAGALNTARAGAYPKSSTYWMNYVADNIYGCPAIGIYSHAKSANSSPQWLPDYPKPARIDGDGFDLIVKSDLAGIAYFIALPKDSPAPTTRQVKAGLDAAGRIVKANRQGRVAFDAYNTAKARIEGLSPKETCDIYIAAKAANGNSQPAPTKIRLTTADKNVAFGKITCHVSPSEAIKAGALWRLTSGKDTSWKKPGQSISMLPVTDKPYFIELKPVGIWITPKPIKVKITDAKNSIAKANYLEDDFEDNDTPDKAKRIDATLTNDLRCLDVDWYKVTIAKPNQKMTITIKTRPDGGKLAMLLLAPGDLKKITSPLAVAMGLGNTRTMIANPTVAGDYRICVYPARRGSVNHYSLDIKLDKQELAIAKIKVTPPEVIKAGARWKLSLEDDKINIAKVRQQAQIGTGVYQTLRFSSVSGWQTPASRMIFPKDSSDIKITGPYVKGLGRVNWHGKRQTLPAKGGKGKMVILADIDGDGVKDIITASHAGSKTVICYKRKLDKDKTLTFEKQSSIKVAEYLRCLVAGDFNGDKAVDLMTATYFGKKIMLHLNNDDLKRSFTTSIAVSNTPLPRKLTPVDIDGDGNLDILMVSSKTGQVIWCKNDGKPSPSFKRQIALGNIDNASNIDACDLDGDGDIDVIVSNYTDGLITWFENDGAKSPKFLPRVICHRMPNTSIIRLGDIDLDGDLDILAVSEAPSRIIWFTNTPGRKAKPWEVKFITTSAQFKNPTSLKLADLDGDGDLDILYSSMTEKLLAWFENRDGKGLCWSEHVITKPSYVTGASALDINGDGIDDVIYGDTDKIFFHIAKASKP